MRAVDELVGALLGREAPGALLPHQRNRHRPRLIADQHDTPVGAASVEHAKRLHRRGDLGARGGIGRTIGRHDDILVRVAEERDDRRVVIGLERRHQRIDGGLGRGEGLLLRRERRQRNGEQQHRRRAASDGS